MSSNIFEKTSKTDIGLYFDNRKSSPDLKTCNTLILSAS